MDFFLKNVRETLEALNKLIDNNVYIVNCKRIRRCNNVKSSDRSKINFIWRSLKLLNREGILEKNGISNPNTYTIKPRGKIDIEALLKEIRTNKDNKEL